MTVYKNNDALAIPQCQMQNSAEWLFQWRILFSAVLFCTVWFHAKRWGMNPTAILSMIQTLSTMSIVSLNWS